MHEFAAIIEELYAARSKSASGKQQSVVVIVGNGIASVSNILYEDKIKAAVLKAEPKLVDGSAEFIEAFEQRRWELFEYARHHTSNALPRFGHCCIHRLLLDGLCRHLITTNYDLYFDEILRRYLNGKPCQNPVATPRMHQAEGYYSRALRSDSNQAAYWKIHGSLSHVVFEDHNGCDFEIYRLPRFAISTNNEGLKKAYKISSLSPYTGYERRIFPKSKYCDYLAIKERFRPFIDWTFQNKRDFFKAEIGAVLQLLQKPDNIRVVLLVGFSGFYDSTDVNHSWNEEIVPQLKLIESSGAVPIFAIVHEKQLESAKARPLQYQLLNRLDSKSRVQTLSGTATRSTFLEVFSSPSFPMKAVEDTYKQWMEDYLDKEELTHA